MKIVETKSGKAYHLSPDTQLEVERTNLYFNEYGEQSLPVTLPDTEHNRQLCGYPDSLACLEKPRADIEVTISEGSYFAVARQAILGAKKKDGISTSFYLNEGAFLSKLQDKLLKDVFGNETVPGVETVEQALEFCVSLLDNENEQYTIFPVLVDDGEYSYTDDTGRTDTYVLGYLNRVIDGVFLFGTPRTIKREDSEVKLPAGCYITPFIRANYLLKRMFAYFGYTLLDNFFTRTEPFDKMVFLNNTCDAIVNGRIRVADLVPDVTCGELLEVFRKKFFCEFIPDEVRGEVSIKLFNEMLDETGGTVIDSMIDGQVELDYSDGYHEIVLRSQYSLSAGNDVDTKGGAREILNNYPNAHIDPRTGAFVTEGFTYSTTREVGKRLKAVSSSSTPYNDNSGLDTEEIEVPEIQPEFRKTDGESSPSHLSTVSLTQEYLCVGQSRWLNSTLLVYGQTSEDVPESESIADGEDELYPMLAFSMKPDADSLPRGTITDTIARYNNRTPPTLVKWSDYSLTYNGENGIFEKFYRQYDDIRRNSFHILRANVLMDERSKMEMTAIEPIVIQGHRVLPDVLQYALGSKKIPMECSFRSIRLMEPTTHADNYDGKLWGTRTYQWVSHQLKTSVTKEEYDAAEYKDQTIDIVYPSEFPTAELADDGKKYYERKWYTVERQEQYWKHEFWLTVEAKESE